MTDQNNTPAAEGKEGEVLVVASKTKDYIRSASGGMNTSAAVMKVLSDKVRELCNQAIARAKDDKRKTVMEKDFI
jgi:histone H3/H4